MSHVRYRIAYNSDTTGANGHGEFVFDSKEEAQSCADKANKDWGGHGIAHWVEEQAATTAGTPREGDDG